VAREQGLSYLGTGTVSALAGLLTAGSLWMLPKPCCRVTKQVTSQQVNKQQTQILPALQDLSQQLLQLLE